MLLGHESNLLVEKLEDEDSRDLHKLFCTRAKEKRSKKAFLSPLLFSLRSLSRCVDGGYEERGDMKDEECMAKKKYGTNVSFS